MTLSPVLQTKKRRRFLVACLVACLATTAQSETVVDSDDKPSSATTITQPNILLIVADDLGWGDVGFHDGWVETPNIDRLAQAGLKMEQFYAQPVCSPTRASMFSGRYPLRFGLQQDQIRPWATYGLPLSERFLPEELQKLGYYTAILGKWHLGHYKEEYLPTRRGFDYQYGFYNGGVDYYDHTRDGGLDWHRQDNPLREEGYTTNLIANEAVKVINQRPREKPLFLYVPFNAPHMPLQAPERYYKGKYDHIGDPEKRIFAGMIAALDEGIGQVIDAAEDSGLDMENTLIVFMSDNGGLKLGSNGSLRGNKGFLYEGGIRVPAVAVWQGIIEPGSVTRELLHVSDFFPTFLLLAHGKVTEEMALDGKDIWPVLSSGAKSPHDFIVHNASDITSAVRKGDWKLVRNGHLKATRAEKPETDRWELFNITNDPGENTNLLNERPEIASDLKAIMKRFEEEAVEPLDAPRPKNFEAPSVWGHGSVENSLP